jgi:Fe-S oxidoreductase
MLSLPEKFIFILAVFISLYFTWLGVERIVRIMGRGQGKPVWNLGLQRLGLALAKTITLQPTFQLRPGPSLFHAFVGWGFMFYILVNFGDLLQAYIPGFVFLGEGTVFGEMYRFGADLSSVAVFVGLAYLLIRRFYINPDTLQTRKTVLLHPKARFGIQRDSAIVGAFIFLHVGGRFLGESFHIAASGKIDNLQPFASALSKNWSGWSHTSLVTAEHIAFWFALGLILCFLPYFPYSKHIHIFFAPLNFALKPQRRSMGELSALNFEDENIEQFGATRLEHLGWEQVMDAYACIMCYRCQEVCPAYTTGKVLSPAALEINKRYFINYEGQHLASGEQTSQTLTEFAISEEAIWACTACGACVEVCPVGNEPMRDILDIRRSLVLMDNSFPEQFKAAYRGMERTGNPWNLPPSERMKWAEGLNVPTIDENPNPEVLWWVGCAPATDARAQKTARAFVEILTRAGVNYAVLGEQERCTGDSARRSGKEDLFYELAQGNVELLNEVKPKRIVTTCPHCLHTLKNEYPAFGGNYRVIHHTQLIAELIAAGKLKFKPPQLPAPKEKWRWKKGSPSKEKQRMVYHDPCYLGRQNEIFGEPRWTLRTLGANLVEPRWHLDQSFCCGAGGAQMWKEEEHGQERINECRFHQIQETGVQTLAVACPFCLTMLSDAGKNVNSPIQVVDVAELVAAALADG